MKRLLIILLIVTCLFYSCNRKERASVDNLDVIQPITEVVSDGGRDSIELNNLKERVFYNGIDFSELPINPAMLDIWNVELQIEEAFQYRNSSLTDEELNSISNEYIAKNGFTDVEQKVVGFWFALDGITQTDQGISFMDALKRSTYPMLAIYPNGYFVISWTNNGPMYIRERVHIGDSDDNFREFSLRGKWTVRNSKLILQYYQYELNYRDRGRVYINLQNHFELDLVDLDALSPDNFSTQPFAAFIQPTEILEQIPHELSFLTKPAYFIKSYYSWEPHMNSPPPMQWSQLFETADALLNLNKTNGVPLDSIITSTDSRLQESYWY